MRRRVFIAGLGGLAALAVVRLGTRAQQGDRVRRVGDAPRPTVNRLLTTFAGSA